MDQLEEARDTIIKEIDKFNPESFYTGLHVLADATTKWMRGGGNRGWSSTITTPTGRTVIENAAEEIVMDNFFNVVLPLFAGGGDGGSSAIDKIKELSTKYVHPESISMDLAYHKTTEFMDKMDSQMKDIARQIGIIKFQDSIPAIPLYQFGIPYELPARTLIPIINGIIEATRVFATFGPESADFLRVPLSVLTAVIDLGRGDWKKALMSMMGTIGRMPAALGIFGKLLRDVFLFVSPDLTTDMRDLFYKSTKSFFAGVLFWSFSTFAPEPIYKAAEIAVDNLKETIRSINQQIENAEKTILGQLPEVMKKCYSIEFRRIPEGILPEFDNLEALQAAFQVPELYCNPVIRKQIEAMISIPPIRLMLELINVPTLDEDFAERCAAFSGKKPEEALLDAFAPIVRKKPGCDIE
jgi:hypothetical protein